MFPKMRFLIEIVTSDCGVTVTSVVRFIDPASTLSNLFNISWLGVTPPSSLWWIQNYSSSSIPRVGPTPPSTGVTDSVLTLSSVTEPGVLYSGPVHVYMMITSTLITRFLLSVIIGLRLLSSHHTDICTILINWVLSSDIKTYSGIGQLNTLLISPELAQRLSALHFLLQTSNRRTDTSHLLSKWFWSAIVCYWWQILENETRDNWKYARLNSLIFSQVWHSTETSREGFFCSGRLL